MYKLRLESMLKRAALIGLLAGIAPLAFGQSAPVANPDTVNVPVGGSVEVNVLANDTGTNNASLETNVSPRASNGWLRINRAAGTITYTPYSGRGTGTDTFAYRLRVVGVGTSTTTVTVNIGGTGSATPAPQPQPVSPPVAVAPPIAVAPPSGGSGSLVANPDTATVAVRSSVTIPVLANDTGTDGATIETNVSPRPGNGWLRVDRAAGTITFTPYSGSLSTDTFAYRLRSPSGATSTALVTVTVGDSTPVAPTPTPAPQPQPVSPPIAVTPPTPPPGSGSGSLVANPDTATVAVRSSVTIPVLANDTGTDGATIETNVSPRPGNGWLRVDRAAGTITFTPYSGSLTTDSFAYRLRSPSGETSTALVTVTVGDSTPVAPTPVAPTPAPAPQPGRNTAPIADAGSNQSITAGQNVTLNGSNSRDSDGSIASYVWSNGSSQIGTGVRPTVRNLGTGIYTFTLRVTDNDGATDTDTVRVTVNGAQSGNAAPIADAGRNQSIQQGEAVTLNASGSRDSDGNVTAYVWTENNTIVARGPIASLNGLRQGDHTIEVTVTDNDGATDVDTVVISVSAPPPDGVLQALADEATLNTARTGTASVPIYFAANDLGTFDPSTFYIARYGAADGTAAKGWIRANERADGVVYYTPYVRNLTAATTDYFTYGIRDAQGNKSEAVITINLLPPEPPAGCDAVNSRNKTISLAMVGNSLMNEIQAKLTQLLVCRGFTADMGTSNPGGYWWYLHDTNQKTLDLIAEGYDLTLIQEQSSGVLTHSRPYPIVASLKQKIDAAGSVMGLYQTWGLQDREPVKTEAILSGYEDIASFFNAPIVHLGRAFDYFYVLYDENPPFSLYFDYAHPTQHGKALISYILYSYLTGESPLDTPTLGLSKADAELLQQVAWDSHLANR